MPLDWSPLWLAVRYGGLAALVATAVAVPLAWLLAHRRFPGSELLDAAANLPLVLPPAVLAYYLLFPAAFHWRRAVAVSIVYTLPLVLRISRRALEAVDRSFENAARSLGAGEWRVFARVTVPLAWRGLVAALLAGFARAFVDFSATAVVASGARNSALLVLLVATAALAALYTGNRLRRGRVWA
jgi:molybdate transport system permease protein